MDGYGKMRRKSCSARESAADIFEVGKVGVEYTLYVISYVAYLCRLFVRSAAYAKIRDYVVARLAPVFASVIIYVVIGIVGGLEAGLVSAAVGVPFCLAFLVVLALVPRED